MDISNSAQCEARLRKVSGISTKWVASTRSEKSESTIVVIRIFQLPVVATGDLYWFEAKLTIANKLERYQNEAGMIGKSCSLTGRQLASLSTVDDCPRCSAGGGLGHACEST